MANEQPLILLIEDSADDAMLIARVLRRHDAAPHVQCFDNGRAALEFLFARAHQCDDQLPRWPHLILLDFHLPLMSGLDTLGQIRANPDTRRLPVVVFSGSSQPRDVHSAASLGANSFVRKPTEAAAMEQTLTAVANYWLQLNLPPT